MLYLFYGSDSKKKIEAKEKILTDFKKKNQNIEVLVFNDINFDLLALENLAGSGGLFGKNFFVVLENVLESDAKDFILNKLVLLQESENTFVFSEMSVPKDTIKKFEKTKAGIQELQLKIFKNEINPFSITYPFEKKDKKETWVVFNKLTEEGILPENIAGILFWKIKTMMLAPNSKKYKAEELAKMSSKLVSLYHDSHRGIVDFKTGLEKFLLEAF